jgi:hypothetical protein
MRTEGMRRACAWTVTDAERLHTAGRLRRSRWLDSLARCIPRQQPAASASRSVPNGQCRHASNVPVHTTDGIQRRPRGLHAIHAIRPCRCSGSGLSRARSSSASLATALRRCGAVLPTSAPGLDALALDGPRICAGRAADAVVGRRSHLKLLHVACCRSNVCASHAAWCRKYVACYTCVDAVV